MPACAAGEKTLKVWVADAVVDFTKAQIDALQKQVNEVKAELIADLKSTPCEVDGEKLVFHNGNSNLTIVNTWTVDTSAVKKAFPGQFLKAGTRETLTVKAN